MVKVPLERPLVKIQPQLQKRFQDIGDARTEGNLLGTVKVQKEASLKYRQNICAVDGRDRKLGIFNSLCSLKDHWSVS